MKNDQERTELLQQIDKLVKEKYFETLFGPGVKADYVAPQLVSNVDLAPTFLALAGLPIPASMQGRSLVPLLHGASDLRLDLVDRQDGQV